MSLQWRYIVNLGSLKILSKVLIIMYHFPHGHFNSLQWFHSPQRNAVLRVVQALDGSEEKRQRVRRVAAHQRDDHPGSKERGLGAPALLGEIPLAQARQENEQQGRQQRCDPVHGRERHSLVTRRTEKGAEDVDSEGPAVVLRRHWIHGGGVGWIKGQAQTRLRGTRCS